MIIFSNLADKYLSKHISNMKSSFNTSLHFHISFFLYHLEKNSNVCKVEREKEYGKSSYCSHKGCAKVALSDNSNRCSKVPLSTFLKEI